jgi:hypothetical protein
VGAKQPHPTGFPGLNPMQVPGHGRQHWSRRLTAQMLVPGTWRGLVAFRFAGLASEPLGVSWAGRRIRTGGASVAGRVRSGRHGQHGA